jgi:para-aminobenzoate synthetase/4-amino-4-deoxychorismate lyase
MTFASTQLGVQADPALAVQADPTLAVKADPALGIFETMLVRNGCAVRAALHLARLSDSVTTLYGARLPHDLLGRVRSAARACDGRGVLRVVATPGSAGVTVKLGLGPPRSRRLPIELVAVECPGGLGAHKWRDRSWLDRLSTEGRTPLLIDNDGGVLEAAFGNIFVERNRTLLTPPITGRLLPGVTRAALIAVARAADIPLREQPVSLDEALQAERLFLTSALAGVAPAVLQDGAQSPDDVRAHALTQLLEQPVHA